ncbi:histone acetyltransferase HAC1 isoform X2 [Carya illinoinensis]|uniref:histone acetyltransferase HAC1 isoform X2 n=1 Tax=Carya illinoinensis TaxID=32201 RepID=UPI001C71CFA4|nr:histone acetyltransferase HAC1 isoform X2 [Carya illinoinensis]
MDEICCFNILSQLQQQQPPLNEQARRKFKDIVKRLEEGLLRSAHTKEDYMNIDTLESRLHNLIKRQHLSNQNQQYPQLVNSSSAIGTMIPTSGMPHSGNSTMVVASSVDTSMISSSGCNSITPTTVNTGSLLPPGAGGIRDNSFNRADGPLPNGYQQSSASFSLGSGGNVTHGCPNTSSSEEPSIPFGGV